MNSVVENWVGRNDYGSTEGRESEKVFLFV